MALAVFLIFLVSCTALQLDESLSGVQAYLNSTEPTCELLELLAKRGFWDLQFAKEENTLRCSHKGVQQFHSRMEAFRHRVFGDQQQQVTLRPVVQWAQSRKHLLLRIKFSHRLDAPAYLNVKDHKVTVTETGLEVSASAKNKDQNTVFRLQLQFLMNVSASESTWKLESVGTMVMNITKARRDLWRQLTKQKEKFPIWWDLKDQIGKDMEEFSKMLEKDEDQKKQKKKPVKVEKPTEQEQTIWGRIYSWFRSLFS